MERTNKFKTSNSPVLIITLDTLRYSLSFPSRTGLAMVTSNPDDDEVNCVERHWLTQTLNSRSSLVKRILKNELTLRHRVQLLSFEELPVLDRCATRPCPMAASTRQTQRRLGKLPGVHRKGSDMLLDGNTRTRAPQAVTTQQKHNQRTA